jgi:integrase
MALRITAVANRTSIERICVMMTITELGRLFEKADMTTWPNSDSVTPETFWKAFLCCAFFTGLRLGDLLALTWDSVLEDRIRVRSVKTNRVLVLPLHRVLRIHLESLRGSGGERVFAIPPESHSLIRGQLERISEAADVPSISLNQIRRLSCTAHDRAQHGSGSLLLGHIPNSSAIDVDALLLEACGLLKYPEAFGAGTTVDFV